ncbi:MAG: hypothetical protein LBU34_17460 [Planctomycetaceae bacterium]|jgi:cellulose synthase/poly-beta-1,6-N-acetylglucosamine synthase-like glycosyltransferase|nr:hypothetical protein [Planctomycetaceae bacterium]
MVHTRDYLPRRDAELAVWSENFFAIVSANAVAWDILPKEISALETATDNFKNLQAQADSPAKNKIIVEQKNEAKKILEENIRGLVNYRLRNPIITNDQRIALGLHVRDTTPTPIPVPTTRPEFDIEVLDFRRLSVSFHDMGSSGKAKPYGVNGAVILYAVLDIPPKNVNDLTRSVLATRTPHVFEFAEEERGRTVYFAICWQNEKGERGPLSEIENAVIP